MTNKVKARHYEKGGQRLPLIQGNAQAIDHILVSPSLARTAEVDVVHLSSELPAAERASDHDAVVARFLLE